MKDYLPIGSIVNLKNGKVKYMIIGYCKVLNGQKIEDKDYIACIYPLGLTDLENLILFNNEDIEKIHVYGTKSEEYNNLKELLTTENK